MKKTHHGHWRWVISRPRLGGSTLRCSPCITTSITPPHPTPSHRMGCRISRTAVASVGGPPPFVPETAPTDLGETKKTTLLKAINDALDIVLVGHRPSFSTLFDCLHTHSLSPASLMRLELRLLWCLGQSRPFDAMILATLFSTAHAAVVGPGQCRCTGWVRWLGEPGLASGTVSLWILVKADRTLLLCRLCRLTILQYMFTYTTHTRPRIPLPASLEKTSRLVAFFAQR